MAVTVLDGASQIKAASITNAEVATAAAIASSKLASWGADRNGGGFKLTNIASGTAAGDAATRAQLDSVASGISWKQSVRLATDAALAANTYSGAGKTLTADANGALTVDGVAVANNNRLLVKNEGTGADNGLYVVTDLGSAGTPYILTRAGDFDADADIASGAAVWVEEGTNNADSGWVLTTNETITMDTTALTFTQFSGLGQITAGSALTKTGNTLDVAVGANGGVQIATDALELKLDGTTLSVGVNGVKVGTITATEIGAQAVTEAKLHTSVAGAGISGGNGTALAVDFGHQEFVGDGAEVNFQLSAAPVATSTLVFKGGQKQREGAGDDYTITGAGTDTVTFGVAPANLANVDVFYLK